MANYDITTDTFVGGTILESGDVVSLSAIEAAALGLIQTTSSVTQPTETVGGGRGVHRIVAGEIGVRNTRFPVGDVRRYRGSDRSDDVAVQLACDAAALGDRRVDLSNGGKALTFSNRVVLTHVHNGLNIQGGRLLMGDSSPSTGQMFYVQGSLSQAEAITFCDMVLDGNREHFGPLGGSTRGIWFDVGNVFLGSLRAKRVVIENLEIHGFTNDCLTLDCESVTVRNVNVWDCGINGIRAIVAGGPYLPDEIVIENVIAEACGNSGVAITDNDATGEKYAQARVSNLLSRICNYGVEIQTNGSVVISNAMVISPGTFGYHGRDASHGDLTLEDCRVLDSGSFGFRFGGYGTYRMSRCRADGGNIQLAMGGSGATSANPISVTVRDSTFASPNAAQWVSLFSGNAFARAVFDNCSFNGQTANYGINVEFQTVFVNCHIVVSNGYYGLRVNTNSRVRLHGVVFKTDSGTTNGIYAFAGCVVLATDWSDFSAITGTQRGGPGTYTVLEVV